MPDATFTVDTSVFNYQLYRLVLAAQLGADKIVTEEAYNFARTMVNISPPLRYENEDGGRAPAFRAGREAVQRNIERAIVPLSAEYMETLFARAKPKTRDRAISLAASGNTTDLLAMFSKMPKMSKAIAANPGDFRAIHKEAVDIYGRVHWRGIHFFTTDIAAWQQYVAWVQSHVGILKSGWLAAVYGLAAARGSASEDAFGFVSVAGYGGGAIPSWVARHGTAYGSVERISTSNSPSVTIINNGSKYPREAELMERALRLRSEAMATKIARLLAGLPTNVGFGTVLGLNQTVFGTSVNYGSEGLPPLGAASGY